MVINPIAAFVFNPDLSLHCERIVIAEGSAIAAEYSFPANGAIEISVQPLLNIGARVKFTPHADEPYLGPAHTSVFGVTNPKPSNTDKKDIRRTIMDSFVWRARPSEARGVVITLAT